MIILYSECNLLSYVDSTEYGTILILNMVKQKQILIILNVRAFYSLTHSESFYMNTLNYIINKTSWAITLRHTICVQWNSQHNWTWKALIAFLTVSNGFTVVWSYMTVHECVHIFLHYSMLRNHSFLFLLIQTLPETDWLYLLGTKCSKLNVGLELKQKVSCSVHQRQTFDFIGRENLSNALKRTKWEKSDPHRIINWNKIKSKQNILITIYRLRHTLIQLLLYQLKWINCQFCFVFIERLTTLLQSKIF